MNNRVTLLMTRQARDASRCAQGEQWTAHVGRSRAGAETILPADPATPGVCYGYLVSVCVDGLIFVSIWEWTADVGRACQHESGWAILAEDPATQYKYKIL